MLKTLIAGAIVAATLCSAATAASAAERHITVTGPNGTTTADIDRHCSGGVCYGSSDITGPNGKSVETSGTCARGFWPDRWNCKATITGPDGGSVTRRAHVVVW